LTGLLLLSGGEGRRMGRPKHDLPHPAVGSWGGHLAGVFEALWPSGPVVVLGEPLPDRPGLPRLDDPREGPAVALRRWCAAPAPAEDRWWVVACDQVRWTPERLEAWFQRATAADPGATRWVMAEHDGRLQPLGGFLPGLLRPALAHGTERSLIRLAQGVPHLVLPAEGPEWLDLDTPEDRRAFETGE
jgi:molybdopterin-guanine dinucleotide biosynthesis protein A